jgi:hypothetical protein
MRSPLSRIMRCGTRPLEACGRPIGYGATAAAIRCRESFAVSSYEQISVGPAPRYQPLFSRPVRLHGTVVQNVADREAALHDRARYQQTAVAIEGLAFGTHQANGVLPRELKKPIQARTKFRLSRHLLIVGNALTIKFGVARTPAKRIAERQIGYAVALQARCEVFAGEPRKSARRRS